MEQALQARRSAYGRLWLGLAAAAVALTIITLLASVSMRASSPFDMERPHANSFATPTSSQQSAPPVAAPVAQPATSLQTTEQDGTMVPSASATPVPLAPVSPAPDYTVPATGTH